MLTFFKLRWPDFSLVKWVGLFAFEFVVVLLGVLTAQTLQERFQARQERESFESTRMALDEQFAQVGTAMVMRGLQARCVEANLQKIIAAVKNGESADLSAITTHPPYLSSALTIWNGELAARARTHMDSEAVGAYDFADTVSDGLKSSAQEEEAWWAVMALASDGGAGLNEIEKAEVLIAAHKLRHAYEGWERAPTTFETSFRLLDIEPDIDLIESYHSGKAVCAREVLADLLAYRQTRNSADGREESN